MISRFGLESDPPAGRIELDGTVHTPVGQPNERTVNPLGLLGLADGTYWFASGDTWECHTHKRTRIILSEGPQIEGERCVHILPGVVIQWPTIVG